MGGNVKRPRRRNRNVSAWPVMPAQCSTCPFNADGDPDVRDGVLRRTVNMQASQICHHPALHGKRETHLCRGARDIQLRVLTAMGLLSEPTDAAFTATSTKYLQGEKGKRE